LETTLLKLAHLDQLIPVETLETKVASSSKISSDTYLLSANRRVNKQKAAPTEVTQPTPKRKEESAGDIPQKPSAAEKQIQVTAEMLEQEWPEIMKKVGENMPVCVVHLSKAKLESIKNNFLHYTTESKVAYKILSDSSQSLSQILTEYFGTPVKIDFKYVPQPKDKYINNPTINDIKKESPKLAKFIEAIDGFIIGQKKPE
jgi:DNA polymerase-3 subunit gamma/tau